MFENSSEIDEFSSDLVTGKFNCSLIKSSMRQEFESLSHTERRILKSLCLGLTNSEIAEVQGKKVKTVKFHLTNVFRKLGTKNRLQTLLKFRRLESNFGG